MKPTPISASRTIVVIDDEPMVCEILKEILSPEYRVLTFESGEKALEWQIQNPLEPLDMVICDYAMKGINGVVTLQKFRNLGQKLKLVLMSGTIANDLERVAVENKFDSHLIKPFTAVRVHEFVKRLMESPRPITKRIK